MDPPRPDPTKRLRETGQFTDMSGFKASDKLHTKQGANMTGKDFKVYLRAYQGRMIPEATQRDEQPKKRGKASSGPPIKSKFE